MTVRLATQADEEPLYGLLLELERDNNSFGIVLSEERIREHIQLGTKREGGLIGVIDAPDPTDPIPLAGSIGVLTFDRFWCASNFHWSILWLFVRSDYRKGHRHADELVEWARDKRARFETSVREPVAFIDSPFSRVRLETKLRWWRRWGEQIGGIFLIR